MSRRGPEGERAPLRLVIAGGGTGGHVFPALAVAEQLRALEPRSEVLLVGSRGGLEETLVPASGYPLHLLAVGKLRGAGALARLRTLTGLPRAVIEAARVLSRFKPHVVVGVGGYASGPTVLAAALLRRPVVLLEQNSVPGTTNRALSRLAQAVVVGFEEAARRLPGRRVHLMGNPIRPAVLSRLEAARAQRAARGAGPPTLLVLGGSQGAHAINELMVLAAPRLLARLPSLKVIHQTGRADQAMVESGYGAAGLAAEVAAFFDDVGSLYGQVDLVLGRSGATTLAELCAAGVPAVLVPYPFAADDHQALNAAEAVAAGGALMIRQSELTPPALSDTLIELLTDSERLARMGAAMRGCAHPDAASAVIQLLHQVAGRERGQLDAVAPGGRETTA